jgi:transcriptional regulator with XRE-family HTH domain
VGLAVVGQRLGYGLVERLKSIEDALWAVEVRGAHPRVVDRSTSESTSCGRMRTRPPIRTIGSSPRRIALRNDAGEIDRRVATCLSDNSVGSTGAAGSICLFMTRNDHCAVAAKRVDLRASGEKRRRMDQHNRWLVRDELKRLDRSLDRWDTAAIASELGNDRHEAFLGLRYTERATARLKAAALRDRIRRRCRQAEELPPEPPRYIDVDKITIDAETISLPQLLRPRSAAEIARRSGVSRSTVRRVRRGQTRTTPEKAVRLLRIADEALAQRLENWIVDCNTQCRARLGSVLEQIAREGPVREWAAGRQLLEKLRRRLRALDREIAEHPYPVLLEARGVIQERITELEDVDDDPPVDPVLEREARTILHNQRHGDPRLKTAGIDPGGDMHRAEQMLAAFGLRDANDLNQISEQRFYKLRARSGVIRVPR